MSLAVNRARQPKTGEGWQGSHSPKFLKFHDFSLKNVEFPRPTELTIRKMNPDNGLQPPLTNILLPIYLRF